MSNDAFPDPYANRVAIIGKTGTGKTTVAGALTAGLERIIFVDPKRSDALANLISGSVEPWLGPSPTRKPSLKNALNSLARKGIDEVERSAILTKKMEGNEPFRAWFRGVPGFDYESLWFYIFDKLRYVTVYIDEVYLTLATKGRSGTYFHALYTQGRERKQGIWAAMQRPAWVPVECLSESEWFYIFRLIIPEDRKRLQQVVGNVALREMKGHQFTVYNDSTESATVHDGIAYSEESTEESENV